MKVNWGALLLGLRQDWLTSEEAVKIVGQYKKELGAEEGLMEELYINECEKDEVMKLIKSQIIYDNETAHDYWYYLALSRIRDSKASLSEKLKKIEYQWAKFDYPEEWRSFIYYLPNSRTTSIEELYDVFLEYLINLE